MNNLFYIFLSTILFSCASKQKRLVVEKWENGKEKVVRTYADSNDTLNYSEESFYESGELLYKGHYLIPRLDGHILCGSTIEDTGFDKSTTDQATELLSYSAQNILPLLANYQPIRQWAGLRPASPNGIPFIGKHPKLANLWINAGQFRNGLVLAPASAQLLVEQMLGIQTSINPMPYQIF